MSTFLVVAAHGYGNIGDDICALSGAHILKEIDPKHKVIITSPPYNEKLVKKVDGIVLSGGGIIYDRVQENVENYLKYLRYGQEHGLFTAAIGLGVQGIVTEQGRAAYREVLNKTDLVTTRSQLDRQMLTDIGVKKVVATQDLGFLADEWIKSPLIKPSIPSTPKPRLGLVLLDVRNLKAYKKNNQRLRSYIEIAESQITQLANDFDVWLFAHSKDDEKWRDKMAKKHQLKTVPYKNDKDIARTFYLYQQMDLVMGLRFHSIILGLLAGKPVVGIGTGSAKLFRLAAESPHLTKNCFKLGHTQTISNVFSGLHRLYEEGRWQPMPETELDHLKARARLNINLLEQALNKN